MFHKRFQNKVAESRFAFPTITIYALLVWLAGGLLWKELYLQFGIFAVSTVLMVNLNNSNSLIRIYSRMVSCTFVALTSACAFLMPSVESAMMQLCLILFYLLLFSSYQDKKAMGRVFYAFACLGTASFWFTQVLYFVPLFWVMMVTNLMLFNQKMFWASLLGIAAPYWFAAGYMAYAGELDWFATHFAELGEFGQILDFESLGLERIVTLAFLMIPNIIGITHYLRNSFLDKIRTRMLYEILLTIDIAAIAFIVLQPCHYDTLLPIIIVSTSCLYAHFAALTKTRATNIVFIVNLLLALALTAFNLTADTLGLAL